MLFVGSGQTENFMALDTILKGTSSGNGQEVDSSNNAQVALPGYTSAGAARGGGPTNGPAMFSENDAGTVVVGGRLVASPETDDDFRLRTAHDTQLDNDNFNQTIQVTGKFQHAFTTLTATSSAAGLLTNSGNITTTTTNMAFGTYAMFPCGGTNTLVCETSVAFSAQPNANTIIDFGMFLRGTLTPPQANLDGVYFSMRSTGMVGVINSGGTETVSTAFPLALGAGTWVYANNAVNRYLIQITNVQVTFWINNVLMAKVPTPVGANFPCKAQALPWSIRHAITGGAAGAATQALVTDYRIILRGPVIADPLGTVMQRINGGYQGWGAAGIAGLNLALNNSANPTPAAATNTTAALGSGLGGQFWETASVAATVDAVIASYQVPAGTTTVPGRRLKVTGVHLSSFVQSILTGAPYIGVWGVAYGHGAVSLATTESASFATWAVGTSKIPRRLMCPEFTQSVLVTQAAGTIVSQPGGCFCGFAEPFYVNPGEFVQLWRKIVGTAASAGTIAHQVQFVYSWE